MTAAALRATFTDFAIVKSRSVMVLRFEVAIDQANAALQALGGVPLPGEDRWVAIARMAPQHQPEPEPAPANDQAESAAKARYRAMPWKKQAVCDAGMLAKNPQFQGWLMDQGLIQQYDERLAKEYIHEICRIESRKELETNPQALERFRGLQFDFQHRDGGPY